LPLVIEATLLIAFGLRGPAFQGYVVPRTVALLCFTMGLQNAMVTKISGAVIRTTHLTGMVTDLGIKLGRMADALMSPQPVMAEVEMSSSSLIGLFFLGGVAGALGFKYVGFLFTIPLAALLLLLAAMPVMDDLKKRSAS
jgi:uncharacterized membrane protein YoaK (UPF0700 family)